MSDQSDDSTRPPKYGGPRNRRRGSPSRRRSDDDSQANSEPRSPETRPRGRHDAQPGRRYGSAYRQSAGEAAANRPARDRDSSLNLGERQSSSGVRGRAPPDSGTGEPGTGETRTSGPGAEARPRDGPQAFETPIDDDLLEAFAALDFETEAQKRVYRYVEHQGVATDEEIHDHIDLSTEDVSIAIQWLVQEGHLEADAGTFRVACDNAVEKAYRLGGLDVTIRPARQEDLTSLVELIRAVTDDRTYVVAESVAAQLASEGTVIRDTDTRSRLFFVATVDDEATADSRLVGWTHLTLPSIEYLDHTAELTVGVHPDFRRRGIGSRLSRVALAWAAANGYRKVYQSLPGTNRPAIDFLLNHGWRVEAVRPDHYRIDGEFVDEVMMAVTLSNDRDRP